MVSELLLTVVPLLVIVDPLASIGLYLSLTARHPADRPWVACKAALFASGVLVLCAFGGATLLKYLGIELYSLRVAGGLLLVFIGMNMLKEGAEIPRASRSPRRRRALACRSPSPRVGSIRRRPWRTIPASCRSACPCSPVPEP